MVLCKGVASLHEVRALRRVRAFSGHSSARRIQLGPGNASKPHISTDQKLNGSGTGTGANNEHHGSREDPNNACARTSRMGESFGFPSDQSKRCRFASAVNVRDVSSGLHEVLVYQSELDPNGSPSQ